MRSLIHRILITVNLIALSPGCSDTPTNDVELEHWPAAYQQFITAAGGSNFAPLDGARMHYVDTGAADGQVILFLHGIPTHSYLWRDVITEIPQHRKVAIDLIGYGRSDRPAGLPYTPAMQAEFLQQFVEYMGFDRVHLVVHDLGGLAGLRWAYEHPERVRSITMFETLWATLPGVEALPAPFGGIGGLLENMRTPGVGEVLVGEQNIFLNALSDFTATGLTEEDLAVYQYPWPSSEDRVNIFLPSGPLAFPFPSNPEAEAFVQDFEDWLKTTSIPKLVFDVQPGVLSRAIVTVDGTTMDQPSYAASAFPNTQLATLQPGGHFVQEDASTDIGQQIDAFVSKATAP